MPAGSSSNAASTVSLGFEDPCRPESLVIRAPTGRPDLQLGLGSEIPDESLPFEISEADPGIYVPTADWATYLRSHPVLGPTPWILFGRDGALAHGVLEVPIAERYRLLHQRLVADLAGDPDAIRTLYDLGGVGIAANSGPGDFDEQPRRLIHLGEDCLDALATIAVSPDATTVDDVILSPPRRITAHGLVRSYLAFSRGAVARLPTGQPVPSLLSEAHPKRDIDTPANRTVRRIVDELRDLLLRESQAIDVRAADVEDGHGRAGARERLMARRLRSLAHEHHSAAMRISRFISRTELLQRVRVAPRAEFGEVFRSRRDYRRMRDIYLRLQRWRHGVREAMAIRECLRAPEPVTLASLELVYERFLPIAVSRELSRRGYRCSGRLGTGGTGQAWRREGDSTSVEIWIEPTITAKGGDIPGVASISLDGDSRQVLTPDLVLVRRDPHSAMARLAVLDATLSSDHDVLRSKWRYGARLSTATPIRWMGRSRTVLVSDWTLAVHPFGGLGLEVARTRRDWGILRLRPNCEQDRGVLSELVGAWLS